MSSDDVMKYEDWEPRAVVCNRGNVFKGLSYDAEVKFIDKQYLISGGHTHYDVAKQAAQVVVDSLKAAIVKESKLILGNYREAKP